MKANNNVRETWAETVTQVGLEDPRLVCIVSDISHFRMQGLAKERPKQYFNLGVCENTIVNIGAGLAMVGKIPVLHTFASFLVDRSFEQLKLAFGYQSLGGNIVVIGSGIEYAFHGVTHHSYVDAALVKSIEGSRVFNPGSSWEFNKLFRDNYDSGALNLFRATTQPHEVELKQDSFDGDRIVIERLGSDLTVVCTGYGLRLAVEAAEELAKSGLSLEILYVHTLKPLDDVAILKSVSKTGKVLTIEFQSSVGGLHGDVAKTLLNNGVPATGEAVDFGENFARAYGSFREHSEFLGFSVENIVQTARRLITE